MTFDVSDATSIKLNGQNVTKISDGTNTLWENKEYNLNYMWMQNTSDEVGTFTLTKTGTPNATELYYSLDKFHWTALDLTQATNTVSVPAGGKIWFRGDNANGFNAPSDNAFKFNMSVSHKAGGDIRSLLSSTDFEGVASMTQGCYGYLFMNDTNLTDASDVFVVFSTIPNDGFLDMFYGCSSLASIPSLINVTTVGDNGLRGFAFGTMITSADISGVLTIGTNGLRNAFFGCSNLKYVKCPNVVTWDTGKAYNWLSGVSANGTFVKPSDLTVTTSSASGIPSGWTVGNYHTWLSFHDVSGSANTLTLTKTGKPAAVGLEYSTDKVNWSTWNESNGVRTYSIPANGTVWVRGNNSGFSESSSNYYKFAFSKNAHSNGTVMSLVDKTCQSAVIPSNGAFRQLFQGSTTLKKAPALTANGLKDSCYYGTFDGCSGLADVSNIQLGARVVSASAYTIMFRGCSSIVTPPTFTNVALTAGTGSMNDMFKNCSSMTSVPSMNVGSVSANSFWSAFYGCTSITDASPIKLNAVNMFSNCYRGMFSGCTGLVTAPEIMGTDFANASGCFNLMFANCTSLKTIKVHFTSWDTNQTSNWTQGVGSTGTFYKPSSLPSTKNSSGNPSGSDYIPYNWNVANI